MPARSKADGRKEKAALFDEVKTLQRSRTPLSNMVEKSKARWVEPLVVVDVEYRAKTRASGLFRHPTFKGVRRDLMAKIPSRKRRN
jgi:ATP-dependent DNA ligase